MNKHIFYLLFSSFFFKKRFRKFSKILSIQSSFIGSWTLNPFVIHQYFWHILLYIYIYILFSLPHFLTVAYIHNVNPFIPKISSGILITRTILMMSMSRIWYWINGLSSNRYLSLFASLVCLRLYRYYKEKFCLCHPWELKDYGSHMVVYI